jgi:hypothetical protein
VVPSMLAALGLVIGHRPTMLVKVDTNTTSLAIVNRTELIQLRTLDHPAQNEISARELADAIHPSMVFFEDNYNAKIELINLAGAAVTPGLDRQLEQETATHCELLVSAEPELAGVAGVFSV